MSILSDLSFLVLPNFIQTVNHFSSTLRCLQKYVFKNI